MTAWSLLLLATGIRTLVLPFENSSTDPIHDWKGSAFEEAISVHLGFAGHEVIDLGTRNRALLELGFTPGDPVSRATAIVLGKTLNAGRLVVGAFRVEEGRIEVEARVIDLDAASTVGIVEDYGPVDGMAKLASQVAKNLFRLEAPSAPSGFDARAKRRAKLSLGALEQSAMARIATDVDERRRHLEKALELEPDYLAARVELGRTLLARGEPRRAIDVLVASGDDVGLDHRAYFDLGLAYLEVDEPASALRVFGALTAQERYRGASLNNQGVALMALGRFPEAVDAFALAAEAGDDPTYLFNHGWGLWRSGKGARAHEQLVRAAELMPWDGQLHLLLAAAASSQARADEAERARSGALLLAPHLSDVDPAVVTGWARAVDVIENTVSKELDEDGGDVAILVDLLDVRTLRELGRLTEAVQLLQSSLYEDPGATELRRELVALYRELGELDDAARELSMVLWSEPSVEDHIQLAEVYLELEEPIKAIGEIEKALSLDPDHREAQRLREELTPPVIE